MDDEREAFCKVAWSHISMGNFSDESMGLRWQGYVYGTFMAQARPSCDAVEVCPDCDMANCVHIRNRTGIFAPKPTLSEDEAVEAMVRTFSDEFDILSHAIQRQLKDSARAAYRALIAAQGGK